MGKVYGKRKSSASEVRRKARKETFKRILSVVPIATLIKYLIFTIFAINLFRALRIRYFSQTGDAAGFVDVLSNTSDPGSLNFAYGVGLQSIHQMVVLGDNFSCPASIPAGTDVNFFYYHAYIIGFVFRYFSALFPDPTIPTLGLLAVSIATGLIAIYNFLRVRGLSVVIASIFLLSVLISPLFYQGLSWNPYINRLFFGPAIYVVLGLLRSNECTRPRYIRIFLAAIFCITLNERASLYIGIAILLCMLVQGFGNSKFDIHRVILLSISFSGVAWYVIWTYFISNNADYRSKSLSSMFINFTSAMTGHRLSSFLVLLTVLLPFIFLAATSFRLLLSVIVLLVPIVVVNDSTGNLDSFYAHYQSDFFPLIVAFAAVGLASLKKMSVSKIALPVWILVSLISISIYNQSNYPETKLSSSFSKSFPEVVNSLGFYFLPNNFEDVKSYLQNRNEVNSVFKQVAEAVTNVNSSISAPEELMPALIYSRKANIDYYPVGVGTSDYVIASYSSDSPNMPDVSIYGVVPAEIRPIWSRCIQQVLVSNYALVRIWKIGDGFVSLHRKLGL